MDKLPYDQVPFYCLGIKQMFREIKLENDEKVNYQSIENYVLGQVINFNNDENVFDTEFEIQF